MTAPAHIRVANELRTRIRSGKIAVGDELGDEFALAGEFDATTRAVHEALGILHAEGLIGGRTGRPLVVLRAVLTQDFDLLVPFAAWVRSLGREPGAHTLELRLRPADQLVAEQLGLPPRSQVLHHKRLRTLDGKPVMIERSNYPAAVGALLQGEDLDHESVTDRLAARGIEFVRALHRIEAVAAITKDAEALEVPRRTPLLQVRRRSYGRDGTPVEAGIDRYRGDAFALVVNSGSSQERHTSRVLRE